MTVKISPARRALIKRCISSSTLAMVAASGLLLPQRVLAHWPKAAFEAEQVEEVLLALLGQAEIADSDKVRFAVGKPASLVTDGRSVSIEITSDVMQIDRVVVLASQNPNPLVMSFELNDGVMLPLKSRIKVVAGESQIIAVIRAEGQLYKAVRDVRIYAGGQP